MDGQKADIFSMRIVPLENTGEDSLVQMAQRFHDAL